MKRDLITSAIGIVVLALLLGIIYPLVVTGVSQLAFPGNANGQKLYVRGKLVGSKIIGQNFGDVELKNGKPVLQNGNPVTTPDPRYFQTRPSGAVPADNAAGTSFANYGPNSTITLTAIQGNISTYLGLNCNGALSKSNSCSGNWYDPKVTAAGQIPVDAVDTSASGIDPDISPANAGVQAHRVAAVRHLPLSTVMAIVSKYTHGRGLGFSGEDGVDVLEVNLALNELQGIG